MQVMLSVKGETTMNIELANSQLPPTLTAGQHTYNTKELLSANQIQERVVELGSELADRYGERGSVHAVTVMNGALHFASDLRRAMQRARPELAITSDQVRVSSYAGTQTSGMLRFQSPPTIGLTGKDVLLIEDIYDTGLTLGWLAKYIVAQEPASLEVAVAVAKDKPGRLPNMLGDVALHTAFAIPDVFVVGYGLDLDQQYRDLDGVYELSPEAAGAS